MNRALMRVLFLISPLGLGLAGCAGPGADDGAPLDPTTVKLVPVHGTVTSNGKPLAGAVVTFLAQGGSYSVAGNSDTDAQGHYELSSMGRKGLPPGDYSVAISYLVSEEGKPQGLGPRSSMTPVPGMANAKERIPVEYSDLGRTRLSKKVGDQGGQFDFQVPVTPAEDGGQPAASSSPSASKAATTGPSKTEAPAADDAPKPKPKGEKKDQSARGAKDEENGAR